MYILGLSAYYHDSTAVLLKDGVVLAAIEEERFSRIKHDNGFPLRAALFCLKHAGITIRQIDVITYYEKPLRKFERILETFITTYPRALPTFLKAIPEWTGDKLKIEKTIRKQLGYAGPVYFSTHHLSHAAASFYTSPFPKASILTIDGVGEYETTSLWKAENNIISPLFHLEFPHSLGLLYSTFTAFLGFKVNEDEYKLMGLAAYGKPIYVNKILKNIIDLKKDGSIQLNMKYFRFREEFKMWGNDFERLLGKPRNASHPILQRHKDLAASIQKVTEIIYFSILNHLHVLNPTVDNLCLAGGVALNALANGKIYKNTPFKKVHIYGAAGDSGGALGAALYIYNELDNTVIPAKAGIQTMISNSSLLLGSSYPNKQIESALKKYKLKYQKLSEKKLLTTTCQLLATGKIVGWFQGQAELGPRALGNHSILCKPSPRNMKTKMNIIKRREQFRPFAGSILQSQVHNYFEVPEKNHNSPSMVFCFPVKNDKRKELAAIVHKDGTCRIQTVSYQPLVASRQPPNNRYYKLIKEFYRQTGIACVLNTSFNLKGEPIVESPAQAIEDFLKTPMDTLVIGDFIVVK
ncbi:hypothetical protein COY90_01650 [Candidatus Roizmanbacteria bacterium CG_4_10_14_0_8_um_filter_39_9]|uniref:Carbamoyltransferase n=1 Tax=Candidatus Roizmanbacteria bacterium CG_4_10_14_0_8_um_filter_39_9 TaxID=1974829 RepID=A0A2M7QED6_9BACT|nr:MAG: hypothetical protein COY90_01650 [Candidatus Roizmanbacteria bacterium CG_4_10_14_0_8_um_filter_39_9]